MYLPLNLLTFCIFYFNGLFNLIVSLILYHQFDPQILYLSLIKYFKLMRNIYEQK